MLDAGLLPTASRGRAVSRFRTWDHLVQRGGQGRWHHL